MIPTNKMEDLMATGYTHQQEQNENLSRASMNTFKTNATIPVEHSDSQYVSQFQQYRINNITKRSKDL